MIRCCSYIFKQNYHEYFMFMHKALSFYFTARLPKNTIKNMQTLIVLSHANTDVYNTYNFALESGVGTWNWKGCLLKHYLKNSYVFVTLARQTLCLLQTELEIGFISSVSPKSNTLRIGSIFTNINTLSVTNIPPSCQP